LDIIFKTQIKHPDSYKPYYFLFVFCSFGITIEIIRNTQQPEKKMRLMLSQIAGAALAVFCFFYILKEAFR
jgi:hypothetical protein